MCNRKTEFCFELESLYFEMKMCQIDLTANSVININQQAEYFPLPALNMYVKITVHFHSTILNLLVSLFNHIPHFLFYGFPMAKVYGPFTALAFLDGFVDFLPPWRLSASQIFLEVAFKLISFYVRPFHFGGRTCG